MTEADLAAEPTRVGILGGTGKLGGGLALRWAASGVPVTIGSRDVGKATARAEELRDRLPDGAADLDGATNAVACEASVVVAAIPATGAGELIGDLASELAGRVVISAVNPLAFDGRGPRPVRLEGAASAAELLADRAPQARFVAALHSVSSVNLARLDTPLADDVLVCGDDEDAVAVAVAAIGRLGVRPVTVGPLRLAATLEALTAVLLSVNRRHAVHAGLRLTGLDG